MDKVAAALDLTEDAVRQRLSRGRKLLHQEILAFVEGALEESNPGRAFTVGVLAALPMQAASAAGATAATTGGVVAKSSAAAKTFTGTTALGAFLTAGVLGYFSLLGFLVFLGGCIGYMMCRAIGQSSAHLEHSARFWRSLAMGFGLLVVVPRLLVFAFRWPPDSHPTLYQVLTVWTGLIYLAIPAILALWL